MSSNSSSSSSHSSFLPDSSSNGAQYSLNGKIIIAALVVLFLVVAFILALHIYAKWFWRRASRRQALWRRRQGMDQFQVQEPVTVGLEKAIVETLPTFVYKMSVSLKDGLECAVCLSEFQEDEKCRLLPKCNHSFHTECIDMWFLSHTTCPLCRTSADQPASGGAQVVQESFTESSASFLLREQTHQQASGELEQSEGGAAGELNPAAAAAAAEALQDAERRSLPSPEWRWRRSTSDRYPHDQGVQFPTNVLFWGDHSRVSSRINSPRLEHGQRGGRSLPHIAIEIPRRQHNFVVPRSSSIASSLCSSAEDQSVPSPSGPQTSKSSRTRLNAIKRLLSRERKVFPTEQDASNSSSQSGATVAST